MPLAVDLKFLAVQYLKATPGSARRWHHVPGLVEKPWAHLKPGPSCCCTSALQPVLCTLPATPGCVCALLFATARGDNSLGNQFKLKSCVTGGTRYDSVPQLAKRGSDKTEEVVLEG